MVSGLSAALEDMTILCTKLGNSKMVVAASRSEDEVALGMIEITQQGR